VAGISDRYPQGQAEGYATETKANKETEGSMISDGVFLLLMADLFMCGLALGLSIGRRQEKGK